MSTDVCPHGQLARSCEICERDAEIAALRETNRQLAENWTNTERLLRAASHALRSYQYGNGSPDLAKNLADKIDAPTVRLARLVEAEHKDAASLKRWILALDAHKCGEHYHDVNEMQRELR